MTEADIVAIKTHSEGILANLDRLIAEEQAAATRRLEEMRRVKDAFARLRNATTILANERAAAAKAAAVEVQDGQ